MAYITDHAAYVWRLERSLFKSVTVGRADQEDVALYLKVNRVEWNENDEAVSSQLVRAIIS